jgi:hypothetical protein
MFWSKQVYVFDDVVSPTKQNEIKERWLSVVPWFYAKDVTDQAVTKQSPRPGLAHPLFANEKPRTSKENFELLNDVLNGAFQKLYEKTGQKGNYALLHSRSFLQFPLATLNGPEYDSHHIDTFKPHLSVLYYVCDADGETVIFENMLEPKHGDLLSDTYVRQHKPRLDELKEKVRVSPKQGRVVIFDGYHWHTATQPQKGIRCVINTNITQQN